MKLYTVTYGVYMDCSISHIHEEEILARNEKSAWRKAQRIARKLEQIARISDPRVDWWFDPEEIYDYGFDTMEELQPAEGLPF